MLALSHSISAPLRAATPFKTLNSGHVFSGILQTHTVVGKFQPEPDKQVILALCVQSGAKPGVVQVALFDGFFLDEHGKNCNLKFMSKH